MVFMHRYLLLFFVISLSSCGARKVKAPKLLRKPQYQIVQRAFVEQGDTTYVNELQFDPYDSARDIQTAFYNNYGRWDAAYEGKYNPMIKQLIWENCKLLGTDEEFYIITDGEESMEEYFTAVMVFDKNNKDLLTEENPRRAILIDSLVMLMRKRGSYEKFYKAR